MNLKLDIRQGIRSLRRHRGLTLAAAATLGLGIGAALTMAGIVEHVLLRPFPVRDQNRVVVSWGVFQSSGFGHVPISYQTMQALRQRTRVFEQLAGVDYNGAWSEVSRIGDRATSFRLGVLTGGLFSTLGVRPILGRLLEDADDRRGSAPVAVIGEGLWRRQFGGDASVLGKALVLTNGSFTIVGVAPDDFELPQGAEAWVTVAAIWPDVLETKSIGTLDLVGRLRPGQTAEDARRELDRLMLEIDGSQWTVDSRLFMTVRSLHEVLVGQVRPAIWVLGAAALLVFLVAVLNLGNLLVVRGLERQQEFAIRRAIGASRSSLIRQIIVETGLMVGLGAVAGLGLALASWRALPALAPVDLSRIEGISASGPVLLVAVGLSFLAVGIVSVLPALSLRETDLRLPRAADPGSSSTPSRVLAWSGAIAIQVMLAVVTLIGSVLLVRTLVHLQRLQPGFEPQDLGVVQIAAFSTDPTMRERGPALVERLVERVRGLPGVSSVTTAITRPLSGTAGWDFGFIAEGQTATRAAANPYLNYEAVRANYFETMGMRMLRGRAFTPADREGAPLVVIVSQSMARRIWPGQDPIGKRIRWAGDEDAGQWRTIVGLVADTRYREFLEPRPSVYVPVAQQDVSPGGYLLVRTSQPFVGIVPALRQAAREVHPDLELVNASPMSAILGQPLARPRFNTGVLLVFSAIAVALTALGLFGLTSFVVVQRRREVGIRRALGAESRQIVGLFLRRGMLPVLVGASAGVGVSLAGSKLLSSLVYGVATTDPLSIGAAVAGFSLVALAAILMATRGAAATDPMVALRAD
jgi:putative ABC transport system permease protein